MHQRSCRVIKDLSGETFENQSIDDCLSTKESAPIIDDQINIKVGVRGGSRHSPHSHGRMSDFMAEKLSVINSRLHNICNVYFLI